MSSYHLIQQDILPDRSSIKVTYFSLSDASSAAEAIRKSKPAVLGVATMLSHEDASVEAVALATDDQVFLIVRESDEHKKPAISPYFANILLGQNIPLAGFSAARIALDIFRDWDFHSRTVELGTLVESSTMNPWSPSKFVSHTLNPYVQRDAIHALWSGRSEDDVCLRAWLSACLAKNHMYQLEMTPKLDTRNLALHELNCLGRLVHNIESIEATRPQQMQNEFEGVTLTGGQLRIDSARYKTRVRASEQTSIVMETANGENVVGRAVSSSGRQTHIQILHGKMREDIERIRVVGREELTLAERAREEFLLLLLRGEVSLDKSPFIRHLWFPPQSVNRPSARSKETALSLMFPSLNSSQGRVADAMIADSVEPVVVVHGPPGTGKTTTISTAVKYWDDDGAPVWIIAQSNVGVKNIALSLVKKQIDFKLIVSKEFHFEWHEHIYEPISDHIIRSDELFSDVVATERLLGGSHVILCTLSMMSNPCLNECRMFRLVPVERLVVDEASQIDTFEFMHIFYKFRNTLTKVCMFGDPKQLPPFGKEAAPDLQTVFDFKHLKKHAYFLNTQYRMPIPLGDFISEHVYNSKLRSVHDVTDLSCVAFVDVHRGQELRKGSSWVNIEEVNTVVNLMRYYYQYRNVAIITPYDPQRAAITKALKDHDLPWECVYNVDSFQGHEAPYVIVSTVRTAGPGFLRSPNRMNVMLSRCQRGMVVVTCRDFLHSSGRSTLLGALAAHWVTQTTGSIWTDSRLVSERSAGLPGCPKRSVGCAMAPAANSAGRPAPRPVSSAAPPVPRTTGVSTAAAALQKLYLTTQMTAAPVKRASRTKAKTSPMPPPPTQAQLDCEWAFPSLGETGAVKMRGPAGRWKNGSAVVKMF